jgi:hypothetical protein
MLHITAQVRRSTQASHAAAARIMRAQARSLMTTAHGSAYSSGSAAARLQASSLSAAVVAPVAASHECAAAAASSMRRSMLLPLRSSSSSLRFGITAASRRGFSSAAGEGEDGGSSLQGGAADGAAAELGEEDDEVDLFLEAQQELAGNKNPTVYDEEEGEPLDGPNVPRFAGTNVVMDDLADALLDAPLEEVDAPTPDQRGQKRIGSAFVERQQQFQAFDDAIEQARLDETVPSYDEESLARVQEERQLRKYRHLVPENEGRDDAELENLEEEEPEEDADKDPTWVADNVWTFERTEVDAEGNAKKVIVDRMGKKLRHHDDYFEEQREEGEEFAGFSVEVRPKDQIDPEEPTKEELFFGSKKRAIDDEDYDEEPQAEDIDYDDEYDKNHHWSVEDPLATRNVKDKEDEYIYAGTHDAKDGGRAYLVGGPELPPTVWEGRTWITWPRTWDNIRKNGRFPSEEEAEAHLKEVLGSPRPNIPVHPPLPSRPQEYIYAKNFEEHGGTDVSLIMTEAEWARKALRDRTPRSWFHEARVQYKRKLHLVRAKYLTEYRHVKALHDANLQARWDQQMENRRAKLELAHRRAIKHAAHALAYQNAAIERQRRQRIKARYTRLNKEMKTRRHQLHMLNYILKERERHWIHPTVDDNGAFVPNKNLSAKLFDTQSELVGFWPRHPAEERKERLDEVHRRKQAKLNA